MKAMFFLRMPKRRFALIVAAVLAYILMYILNSLLGGYWGPVAGNLMWSSGIAMPTRFIWEPYFGYRDRYNITTCGMLWYPLICIDQRYIHPPYDLDNANDEAILSSKDNHIKWHPEAIRKQNRLQGEKGLWRNHCVEDPEFCLQSATNLYSGRDTHFLALLLYDKYNTNAISKLQAVADSVSSNSVYSDFEKRDVRKVIQEVKDLISRQPGVTH
jgi:hypothetical protein